EGEARQGHLLSELTHRVRNILGVIQAIARHTLRGDKTNKDLIERFEGRLSALASAHTLLVESDWKGTDLAELVNQQLAPYRPQQPQRRGRVGIEGGAVLFASRSRHAVRSGPARTRHQCRQARRARQSQWQSCSYMEPKSAEQHRGSPL